MKNLILLVGPPGSGKSTWCQKTVSPHIRISQDDQGKGGHLELFNRTLLTGENIIVDRMNFNKGQRRRYLDPAKAAGYKTKIVVLHESEETCLKRCVQRTGHPTIQDEETAKSALDTFFRGYERVENSEADSVERIWPHVYKEAIVCDLDGTLCNIDHRLHHVRGEGKKNWPGFFEGIAEDKLNQWCLDILHRFLNFDPDNYIDERTDIVLCSGRGEEYRKASEDWLSDQAVYYHEFFMRRAKDSRQDYLVKEIILDFELRTRYKILFAIDDRQQVVDMWRRNGIVALQCAKGDF